MVQICMGVRGKDVMFLFNSDEPGRTKQCNFTDPKHLKEEAEVFLDEVFKHLLQG